MRQEQEENNNNKWSQLELPTPEELTPISQSLITPNLAIAFNIHPHAPPLPPPPPHAPQSSSAEFDSPELTTTGSDEPARTLKRPRLVWTPQLHKRFVDAVAHLGIKNAVPKTIMQLMSVDGLTRENVASHLQKYRLYLKRMQQGISGGGGAGGDAATERLFASEPVPAGFLQVPVGFAHTQNYHHQYQQQQQQILLQQQQFRHFGGAGNGNGHFDNHHHSFVRYQQVGEQQQGRRVGQVYVEDLETGANGRKILTLFPTGDD